MELSLTRTGTQSETKKFPVLHGFLLCLCNRLKVILAKIQQSLPELKREEDNVLESLWEDLIYNDDSTSRSGGVLCQADFIPQLSKLLQESPSQVIADFEEIRKYRELLNTVSYPSLLM